jgi:hypothetical protein
LPTSILSVIKYYAKRGAILLYKLTLVQKQIYKLKVATKATARYKLYRRKYI